jgi:hypothetical protein
MAFLDFNGLVLLGKSTGKLGLYPSLKSGLGLTSPTLDGKSPEPAEVFIFFRTEMAHASMSSNKHDDMSSRNHGL